MTIVLGVLVVLLLTVATGYFVAQEFAYVAVDRTQLRQLADAGDVKAERAYRVTERLSFMLSGAQLGITVTGLLVGYAAEPLIGRGLTEVLGGLSVPYAVRLAVSIGLVMLFSTAVQMVLGELAPKNLALARSVPLARRLGRSTLVYLAVAGPVIRLFDSASTLLLRTIGIEPVEELSHAATAEDLERIIEASADAGSLDPKLSKLLDRGLAFRSLTAAQVMTPWVDVESVAADDRTGALVELMDRSRHSRFPVIDDDERIVGVVGFTDLLGIPVPRRLDTPILSIIHVALVVPESATLPAVLGQLRERHTQIAVVIDEHGGAAGVLTFEDLAEELVGQIYDEDDLDRQRDAVEHGDGSWSVPGRFRIDQLEGLLDVTLPEDHSYDTVSGLVLAVLERTASPGDQVHVAIQGDPIDNTADRRLVARVERVSRRVPDEIRVHLQQTAHGDDHEQDTAEDQP